MFGLQWSATMHQDQRTGFGLSGLGLAAGMREHYQCITDDIILLQRCISLSACVCISAGVLVVGSFAGLRSHFDPSIQGCLLACQLPSEWLLVTAADFVAVSHLPFLGHHFASSACSKFFWLLLHRVVFPGLLHRFHVRVFPDCLDKLRLLEPTMPR